jgi:hypothetical protein
VRAAWEPPGGSARVAGGLLGVVGGEAFAGGLDTRTVDAGSADRPLQRPHDRPHRLDRSVAGTRDDARVTSWPWSGRGARRLGHGCEPDGPVTAALVDVCHSYVARRGRGVPTDVAERHDGVAGPGWLLAVAAARSHPGDLVADTLELGSAAGVPAWALGDCVAYVELAAELLVGRSPRDAIARVTGAWAPARGAALQLRGEPHADALAAGVWALVQPGGVTGVLPALAARAPSSVAAAAAGLLGLRDGGGEGVPAHWQRPRRSAASCLALAPGLVRARCRNHLGQVVTGTRHEPGRHPGWRGLAAGVGAS